MQAQATVRQPHGASPTNYLNKETTIRSWLLATDHKRIALLYLFTIIIFFAIAATAAALMRAELLTPRGDLVLSETYNKLFTIHGVLMVWFFLIPSIPAVLGNFLLPIMIGARDLAFPRLNLLSWYIYSLGWDVHRRRHPLGWGGHGVDLLHAAIARCTPTATSS